MPIETSENELGGTTYEVSPEESLAALPEEIARHVDAFDRDVFLDPENYAADLAEDCPYPPMRRWLEALSYSHFYRLQIHCADVGWEQAVKLCEVYFQYYNRRLKRFFHVQFSKAVALEEIHPALGSVFDRVSCIGPSTWGIAGGQLNDYRSVSGSFADMGWISPQDIDEAKRTRQLYTSLSGDEIGYRDDGMAVLCEHGRLEEIGPIENFLDLYFEVLLAREADTYNDIAYAEKLVAVLKRRHSTG